MSPASLSKATLVASEELSEDVVYEFVKAMFDNKDALTEGHAKFGFLDPETASAGATVTMHPVLRSTARKSASCKQDRYRVLT